MCYHRRREGADEGAPSRSTVAAWQQLSRLLSSLQATVQGHSTEKGPIQSTMSVSETPDERGSRLPTEQLQGIVERVTYHAEDSGYSVARLKVPSHSDLV